MRRSRTSASLALVAAGLAAAAAGPLTAAAPAGAALSPIGNPVVACPLPLPANPATDLLKLTGVSVDFGTSGLNSSNDPTCSSTVRWNTAGGTTTPEINGDVILKNALGVNARVIASYYDVHGTSLGPSRVTSTKIGTSNAEQSFPITINGFSDPLVYEVSIATQVLSAGSWVDVDRESVYLSSSTQPADSVLIAAPGQDFGAGPLVGGAPSGPGALAWDLSLNNTRATLTGELIMTGSFGVNARMRLTTFDVRGAQLDTQPGTIRTPASNAQQSFPVNLSSPRDPAIYRAEASIEVQVGAGWVTVGTPVDAYL